MRGLARRLWPILVIVGIALLLWASGLGRHLSFETLVLKRQALRGWVEAHPVAGFLGYGAAYALAVALSIPGAVLLTIMAGFLFGAVTGSLLAIVAATLGASLLFLAARTSLGEMLARRAGPFVARVGDGFRRDAASYMLFLRLVPVFPFWLVNLAPALFGVPLRTFLWTTAVGIAPGTLAFALAGAGLDSVVEAQAQAHAACVAAGRTDCPMRFEASSLLTPELLLAFVGLGIVALVPIAVRRWRGTGDASTGGSM
jgi:uncharacterized membrane protein YdjX (TVP38/TMEM64 family)